MFANNITYTLETTTDQNGRFYIHSLARFELVLLIRSFVYSFILSIIIVPEYGCSVWCAYMICYSFCLALIMPSLGILLLSSLCLSSTPKSWARHRARILGAFNLATTVYIYFICDCMSMRAPNVDANTDAGNKKSHAMVWLWTR